MAETHALLFTDVVDSTKLSEELGDTAMVSLWSQHDALARELLQIHRGTEIDKADGFLLLFDTAADAVAYAVAYHQALRSLDPPLFARAGLHVGEVILTENAPDVVARGAKPIEVDGLAKPTAARVMSVAVGGQTLLTDAARISLGQTSLRLASHGHWRMKGIAEPMELFEVGDADAPFTPPPDGAKAYRVVLRDAVWMPVREVPHRLPAEHDRFVGRETDLQELARRFDEGVRLITVVGAGGTGKTRLATRFARTWLGDFSGGAWFCDLSDARDVSDIVASVARTLDVTLDATDAVARIGHAIVGRGSCLVILDNFEQVVTLARATVGAWLDRAPGARFLVTSREVLGFAGEEVLDLDTLAADAAIELFVTRAKSANRRFQTMPSDRPLLEALVRMLDGLPLAIELAAARAGMLSTQQIHDRMRDRFELLASTHGRADRHATLRAAIDGSWELLSEPQRSALAQLSVFEGGFTIEAADAVLALPPGSTNLAAISALVDKSLVRRISDERLGLLVSIQSYASEKLAAVTPEVVIATETRHGMHYATFGTDEAIDALTLGGAGARKRLSAELGNIVSACRRAAARGDGPSALALLGAAEEVYELAGPSGEGVVLAESVCGMRSLSVDERTRAAALAGRARINNGELEAARIHLETALANPQCETRIAGEALHHLGRVNHRQGRMDEARALYEQSLSVGRATRDAFEGRSHGLLGLLYSEQGRPDAARAHFVAAVQLARERGDRRAEGGALNNLTRLCSDDIEGWNEKRRLLESALDAHRDVGNRYWEAISLNNLARTYTQQGLLSEAEAYARQALAMSRAVGNPVPEALTLVNLCDVLRQQQRLTEAKLMVQSAIGILRDVDDRFELAGALVNLAEVSLELGEARSALQAIEEAGSIAAEIGSGPASALGEVITTVRALVDSACALALGDAHPN